MVRPGPRSLASLFARKSLDAAVAETERSGFRRSLGAFDLTALGVAAIVGAGIFVGIGNAAAGAGPAVIVSYIIAGLACVFAALAYAELASLLPGSGSAYTYTFVSLGRLPAFLVAWFLILEYVVGNMFVAQGWSGYFNQALDDMGWGLPPWLQQSAFVVEGGGFNLGAGLIALLVAGLVVLGIRESVRVGNVLVVFKIVIVVFFILAGLAFIRPENWAPFSPSGTRGVLGASAAAFFAYIGFDTVSATAEEARHPRRDLPVGIVASLAISMVLYVVVAIVLTGMSAYDDLDPTAPLAAAFEGRGITYAGALVTVGALVATTTVLLAFTIGLPRIFHAVARDGLLPSSFTRLHPRFRTPVGLTVVGGIVTMIGAGLVPETVTLDLTSLGTLAIFVVACAGVLVLKRIEPDAPRRFRTHWAFPVLGIVFCVVIAAYIDLLVQLVFLAWIGIGLMLYGFYGHARAEAAATQAPGR